MGSLPMFNELLLDFVENLAKTYHMVPGIAAAPGQLEIVIKTDPTLPHKEFMSAITPHVNDICSRNDQFFTHGYKNIAFLKDVNFEVVWNDSPEPTKVAVWEYMYNLVLLGGSIQNIPPSLMTDISRFVESYESTHVDKELNVEDLIVNLQQDPSLCHLFSKQ